MTNEQATLLQEVATDVALVKQAIVGNGVKGLNQRMAEVEGYIKKHPQSCPFLAGPSARALSTRETLIAIIGAVGVIGSLVVAVVK